MLDMHPFQASSPCVLQTSSRWQRHLRQAIKYGKNETVQPEFTSGATHFHTDAAETLDLMGQLEFTIQMWELRLNSITTPSFENVEAAPKRDFPDSVPGSEVVGKKSSAICTQTIAMATATMPAALREKLNAYRNDARAREDLRIRCNAPKSKSVAKDWIKHNKTHFQHCAVETEVPKSVIEQRRFHAEVVAQRRQLRWQQTMDRRMKLDDPPTLEAPTTLQLDTNYRLTVWLTAMNAVQSHFIWLRQAAWVASGGLGLRDFEIAGRVRQRLMPAVVQYRKRRTKILWGALRGLFWLTTILLRHRIFRQHTDRVLSFLRSLAQERRFCGRLHQFAMCVRRAQQLISQYLRQKSLRIQVLMLQVDARFAQNPESGAQFAQHLSALLITMTQTPTSGAESRRSPRSHRSPRTSRRHISGHTAFAEELAHGLGVPFPLRLQAVEAKVFAMRRQCINALIASGTWASGDAAAASIPTFPRYIPRSLVDEIVADVTKQYRDKLQAFANEVRGRVRSEGIIGALRLKLAQYRATCAQREAEWLARHPWYTEAKACVPVVAALPTPVDPLSLSQRTPSRLPHSPRRR